MPRSSLVLTDLKMASPSFPLPPHLSPPDNVKNTEEEGGVGRRGDRRVPRGTAASLELGHVSLGSNKNKTNRSGGSEWTSSRSHASYVVCDSQAAYGEVASQITDEAAGL